MSDSEGTCTTLDSRFLERSLGRCKSVSSFVRPKYFAVSMLDNWGRRCGDMWPLPPGLVGKS